MERPNTPTLRELAARGDDKRTLEEFLEWLESQRLEIKTFPYGESISESPENLIYRFLEIDPRKVDEERRALIDWQCSLNESQ